MRSLYPIADQVSDRAPGCRRKTSFQALLLILVHETYDILGDKIPSEALSPALCAVLAIQAAVIGHHRLGSLETPGGYLSQFWRLEAEVTALGMVCLVRDCFLRDLCPLTVTSHGRGASDSLGSPLEGHSFHAEGSTLTI